MKRVLSLMLSLALVLTFASPAYAASDEAVSAANALYEMGLFGGTGTDANGDPVFDLDRAPTRHEAVTMLVRLLGKTDEAESGTWELPFTDVAAWAKPYVGYAYANGLAGGTSETAFSGDEIVTASQYLTLVLRALGYESGVDFQWDRAWELSDRTGLTDGRYHAGTSDFTRGDVAIISYRYLSIPHKGQGTALPETPAGTNPSMIDQLRGGTWMGINMMESSKVTEFYQFQDTTYSCAVVISDQSDTILAMGYEEGRYSIYGDNELTLVKEREYHYYGNGSQTQVSEEVETHEYTLALSNGILSMNSWRYMKDPQIEETASTTYETVKARVMEFVAPQSSDEGYGYLAAADFRNIRRQYSNAVAQCGYAYAYTDLNGDSCVLTIVYYKIISNYSVTTLHNLTQNRTIENPADYYNKQASRAYGSNKMHYWDLSSEVLAHSQEMLKAMLDVMQTGSNTGNGAFVDAATLNR